MSLQKYKYFALVSLLLSPSLRLIEWEVNNIDLDIIWMYLAGLFRAKTCNISFTSSLFTIAEISSKQCACVRAFRLQSLFNTRYKRDVLTYYKENASFPRHPFFFPVSLGRNLSHSRAWFFSILPFPLLYFLFATLAQRA